MSEIQIDLETFINEDVGEGRKIKIAGKGDSRSVNYISSNFYFLHLENEEMGELRFIHNY